MKTTNEGRFSVRVQTPKPKRDIPDLLDKAIDGKPLKAALIGCGSRGTGVAINFLDAGDELSIVALADMFPDRKELKDQKGVVLPDNACFLGFDAYRKVCELPVDIALIASPSCFHPEHTKHAIEKGKHVFVEKPAAIDPTGPTGYRSFILSLRQAKTKGLNVINGAQYHWDTMTASDLNLIPAEFASEQLGMMDLLKYETVPLPGTPLIIK